MINNNRQPKCCGYRKCKKRLKGEPPKLNGFIFIRDDDDDDMFYVATKEFWDKNGYIDDSIADDDIPPVKDFVLCMEACLEYRGTNSNPIELLKQAGYLYIEE